MRPSGGFAARGRAWNTPGARRAFAAFAAACLLGFAWCWPAAAAPASPADRRAPPAGETVLLRDLEYGRTGDRVLRLDLVHPRAPQAERLPLVVMIHGGGWQQGDKSRAMNSVTLLAARGDYVGASIGYRLSGEAIWPAQIHDCKAAIRWLRAHAERFGIDPDRIGVWGTSAGGHLANLLGTTGDVPELEGDGGTPGVSSRVQAVASYCGPTDFLAAEPIQRGREPSSVTLLFGGSLESKRAEARQASPLNYVTSDDAPFLLVHGTADPTVPFQQSVLFHAALRRAGVEAILLPIEGGGHGSGGLEARHRAHAFFDRHLHRRALEVSLAPIPVPAPRTPPPESRR